ncbi:hypothetical protein SARC_14732 [Sphaeroforma arctica JP610]|uniref:RGS domain-containing protein n=1 Tax=Sphaeroforma arctica JP610 TaxID=667725 RepID=A0A0L0F7P9_9EUKA|nr:hypothetical protein SARC_14732 [Sphaeroforma arctica JP610]KNC72709.1 hypothetical protein SARC_14732 [Sphaeroforma arctica JP610]|eukprot:XP_014146611.1 hypothetical protein SARC_14732 [Sphaeroforma arctica JP610]
MRDMDSPGIRHARVVQTENETMDALRSALAVYARNISHDDMFGTSHANGPLQSKRTGQVHPKNVGKDQVSGTSSGSSGDHGAKIGGEIKTNESKATHAQDQGIHTQAQSWGMASEESCVHPGTHAKRERRGSRARKSVGNIYRDVLLSHHIPDSTKSRSRSPSSPAVSKRNWTREGGDIEEHAHTDTNTDAYTFRDVGSDALTGTLGPQNSITEARTDTADSSVSRTVPITEGIECAHCQGTGKKPSPADDPLCACTCGEATRRGGPELADREPLSGVEVKVLRSAQRQMLSLMALDSFPRFLNSGLGTEFVERCVGG